MPFVSIPEVDWHVSRISWSDHQAEDRRLAFARLFDKHNELDHKVKALESGVEHGGAVEIENLKKEKLRLKDEMYAILRKADGKA